MKRFRALITLGLAALLLGVMPAVAEAQLSYKFWAGAVDEHGNKITSGVRCQVYTAGTDTAPSIYSNNTLATIIQGASIAGDANGICEWYSSASTAVDLYVWHRNGRGVVLAITPYSTHRVILRQSSPYKVVRLPYSTNSSSTQTGYTIPKGSAVWDVYIQPIIASGGGSAGDYHIAIGTQGTNHGFCTGGNTTVGGSAFGVDIHTNTGASGGWLRCHAVLATSTRSTADYYITHFHSGSLISRGAVGQDSTSYLPGHIHAGSYMRFPYISGGGTSNQVVYTTRGSAVAGHFYLILQSLGVTN